jgi:2',3'-cyclic-nucleotide 2'-phosphodiesterase (5'-nucleotidase family)
VLDAGNLLFFKDVGPSLSSAKKKEALFNAQLMVQAFNLMGCDAVGIGADDLRVGPKDFAPLLQMAQSPFVSANAVAKDGQKLAVATSVVKNAGGLRWGIFSLMSANSSSASPAKGWRVLDPVGVGRQMLKDFEGKADFIILLAAMPVGELRALLPQLPGVTIAVAADEASGLIRPLQMGGATVLCCPPFGKYLGVLRISLKDPKAAFADAARITELERALAAADKIKGSSPGPSPEEKKKMEAELQELKKGNIYRNELVMLGANVQEDPGVKRFIEDFRAQQQKTGKGCQ